MSDETKQTPKLELVSQGQHEQLDAEEQEFNRLRRDVPGVRGAADVGLLTISVGRQPVPKNEFYRTHPDFRPVVSLVSVDAGLDKHYVAIAPNMIEPLRSLGISSVDHVLYLIVTPRGALRIIPVRGPDPETGETNEWSRTKEQALLDGVDGWVRMYSDREAQSFRSFPAPAGRFGEPTWPDIKPARIFKMAFRDKGRLIDSTEHVLVQRWAGRDRDK